MIADQEGIPLLGEAGRLGQVAERRSPIQSRFLRALLPHFGHQIAHEADLVGIAVGMAYMAMAKPLRMSRATKARPPSTPPATPHNGLSRLATRLMALPSKVIDPIVVQALRQRGLGLRGSPG